MPEPRKAGCALMVCCLVFLRAITLELLGEGLGSGLHHNDIPVLCILQHLPNAAHIKGDQRHALDLQRMRQALSGP